MRAVAVVATADDAASAINLKSYLNSNVLKNFFLPSQDLVILEKSSKLGGTWAENVYPGVACDVPSHLYSFSFFANPRYSQLIKKIYTKFIGFKKTTLELLGQLGQNNSMKMKGSLFQRKVVPIMWRKSNF